MVSGTADDAGGTADVWVQGVRATPLGPGGSFSNWTANVDLGNVNGLLTITVEAADALGNRSIPVQVGVILGAHAFFGHDVRGVDRNLLFVKGGVPGARHGYVLISK